MWRTVVSLAFAAAVLLAAGCDSSQDSPSGSSSDHGQHHGQHHDPQSDPQLVPAGSSGTAALGQPIETMDELSTWVRDATGGCSDVTEASLDELAEYLGPTRVTWYGPFVGEWATCGIEPYDRLGLVLFGPGQQRALQEFWLRGLASGEIGDNPDWAFGNGFAVTAGPLGAERLGLRYLWCEPVDNPNAHTIAADVDGCVYATTGTHS